VKCPLFASVGCAALSLWLLAGCAGTQTRSDRLDVGNRPQLLIPGATASDVAGVAKSSAQAKGWGIVESAGDRLVMQRTVDPSSPSALALGAAKNTVAPVVEVTAIFVEQSGGVNVALGATLITQPPGEKSAKRMDYTENYRDALTQSLQSLRANWTPNRGRVADTNPTASPDAKPAPTAAENSADNSSNPQAWGPTAADAPSPTSAPTRALPVQPRLAPAPEPTPAPGREWTAPTAPEPNPASPLQWSTPMPTPGVPDSNGSAGPSSAATYTPSAPSQPTPEPVASGDHMLTLSPAGRTGVWAYYAEQYARLRGCAIDEAGAQLIENRADGEVHKVSCVGSASFLLKCQNGVCRGLE